MEKEDDYCFVYRDLVKEKVQKVWNFFGGKLLKKLGPKKI